MMELLWRVPRRRIALQWRVAAQDGINTRLGLPEATVVRAPAVLLGPAGPTGGGGGGSTRIDASLAGTWVLPHTLGHVPLVQVYLSTGEAVLADVVATSTTITVAFATPQQGFIIIA